jgi:hypothetical protein
LNWWQGKERIPDSSDPQKARNFVAQRTLKRHCDSGAVIEEIAGSRGVKKKMRCCTDVIIV